jgi:hypothetical protein
MFAQRPAIGNVIFYLSEHTVPLDIDVFLPELTNMNFAPK